MSKVAVLTDSNSGITQVDAKELGVYVIPMPFFINNETYYEDIDLTQEQFYEKLVDGVDISTSMPMVGSVTDTWDKLLQEYDEIVYVPMSSGLSSSCETAYMLSQDYDGKVQVVNNQRISVTQRQSVMDAKELAENGKSAAEDQGDLGATQDGIQYLYYGGYLKLSEKRRKDHSCSSSAWNSASFKTGSSDQGERLDAFAKARTVKQAKSIMIEAMKKDFKERFESEDGSKMHLEMAYTHDLAQAEQFKKEVQEAFPNNEIIMQPLSLSVSCHIGPGAIAIACSKKIEY